jgi:CRP-like cAMP-binding protein
MQRPIQQFSYTDGAKLLISDLALPELTPAQALRIVPFMKLASAGPGSVLFRPGGPGNQFMVMLVAGDAVVEGQSAGASEWTVLRTLLPGSLFGELGATESMARAVVVRATSETCLASLDDDALAQITQKDPGLAFALLRGMLAHVTRRLRAANNKIETLSQINKALRDEWAAQSKSDRVAKARLDVMMKIKQEREFARGMPGGAGDLRKQA